MGPSPCSHVSAQSGIVNTINKTNKRMTRQRDGKIILQNVVVSTILVRVVCSAILPLRTNTKSTIPSGDAPSWWQKQDTAIQTFRTTRTNPSNSGTQTLFSIRDDPTKRNHMFTQKGLGEDMGTQSVFSWFKWRRTLYGTTTCEGIGQRTRLFSIRWTMSYRKIPLDTS